MKLSIYILVLCFNSTGILAAPFPFRQLIPFTNQYKASQISKQNSNQEWNAQLGQFYSEMYKLHRDIRRFKKGPVEEIYGSGRRKADAAFLVQNDALAKFWAKRPRNARVSKANRELYTKFASSVPRSAPYRIH
jgi:hypothetical protein